MKTRIIGIDLGVTAKHKAVVLDQASNEFVSPILSFQPYPAEVERILKAARAGSSGDVALVAVLEATGMAWYAVGVYLQRQGVTVYRINGQKTKQLRQVYWQHTGSDRIDARVLARLYQLEPERLVHWQPANGDQLALQRACREYDRWRRLDVAIQNRIQAYDQWAWNGLQRLIPATALPWMRQHWYDPWQVSQAGLDHLQAAWQHAAPQEPADTDWIAPWLSRAQQMTALYGTPEMVGYTYLQATIARQLTLQAEALEQRARLRQELIEPLYCRLHPDRHLESIPGIALASAATYIAFIQAIDRFDTVAQFRKWCGIIPASHQSGEGEAKGLSLTKAGPNLIKATLYLNAHVSRLRDVQLAAIYYDQMVNHGQHHHHAICACASHLASRIFTVLKEHRPYQLRNLDGQPIDKATSRHLCLTHFRVPDEVRQRNNKKQRRQQKELHAEKRYRQRRRR